MFEEKNLTHSDLSFLKKLEKYTFDSKMCYCQRYASRIMTISEVSVKLMKEQNIMPGELEAFVAFSVIYDNPNATEDLDDAIFAEIITLLRNFWHPELTLAEETGTYSNVFMMISTIQQFPAQGLFLQKMFRYDYFFRFSNENVNMEAEFINMFGDEYRLFEVFAFIVFMTCSIEGQNQLGRGTCGIGLCKALSIGNVRKQLSINQEKYKKLLDDQYKGNILDYYYGLKIQYLYPIIESVTCAYIPSPYLVVNAVTESMLNRLTFGNNSLRRKLGKEVIEEYLYSIYKELSTVTWISREFEYKIEKRLIRTPDVLVEEFGNALLFDTKALSPNLKMRQFDAEEIEKESATYADDIFQLYQRILDLVNGHYSLEHEFEQARIFGVVVVLEDAAVARNVVYEKVFAKLDTRGFDNTQEVKDYIQSHIKVVPLSQIEQTVLIGHSYMQCLLNQVEDREKWNYYNFFIPTEEFPCIPSYEKYCSEIKKMASDILK